MKVTKSFRNYLRVRGEYDRGGGHWCFDWELPPRARRIPGGVGIESITEGTTSACAENTASPVCGRKIHWNYLRVRGEYLGFARASSTIWELPPRARRIRNRHHDLGRGTGTTSACAENTLAGGSICGDFGNYLRVRGEYIRRAEIVGSIAELPPRARRIRPQND